jgi:hypothetical protein
MPCKRETIANKIVIGKPQGNRPVGRKGINGRKY